MNSLPFEAEKPATQPLWACVDVSALPLQLALRDHAAWRDDPVVVVEEDHPLARVLWLNRKALQSSIRRGMRFGEARTLVARVHAAVVSDQEIEQASQQLFSLLLEFSPRVEPAKEQPGIFWLDPSGLSCLFGDLHVWSQRLFDCMTDRGLVSSVVVGFNRYRVYAIARSRTGPLVIASADEELVLLRRIGLARIDDLSPKQCEGLAALGVHTLGDLLNLSEGALRQRFGESVARVHAMCSGVLREPFAPQQQRAPVRLSLYLEPPDDDTTRLLFVLKGGLAQLMQRLTERCESLVGLDVWLHLDHAGVQKQQLQTASPTLDVLQVLELLRLRLDSVTLAAPVEQIDLIAQSWVVAPTQQGLFKTSKRDLAAAERALARIRAALGPEAVTRAVITPGILPEARYVWRSVSEMRVPRPPSTLSPLALRVPSAADEQGGVDVALSHLERLPLVRKVWSKPQPLRGLGPPPPRQII